MTLSDDVNLDEYIMSKEELSGADIKAICTESGLLALRERRMKVAIIAIIAILVVIEAMKMNHTITAHQDGVVDQLYILVGEQLELGASLMLISKNEE